VFPLFSKSTRSHRTYESEPLRPFSHIQHDYNSKEKKVILVKNMFISVVVFTDLQLHADNEMISGLYFLISTSHWDYAIENYYIFYHHERHRPQLNPNANYTHLKD